MKITGAIKELTKIDTYLSRRIERLETREWPAFVGGGTINLGGFTLTVPATMTLREKLSANRTYYVRVDGNDANTGLVDSAAGAFLTIQKAVNTVSELDINGKIVTIQVRDGTYNSSTVILRNVVGFMANGNVVIQGNAATPTNVIINSTSHCFYAANLYTTWTIKNMKLIAVANGLMAVGSTILFSGIDFGACGTAHIYSNIQSRISATGNYTISGGSPYHYYAGAESDIDLSSITVTVTANVAITYFAYATTVSLISAYLITYSLGAFTVTGTRYIANLNGVVNTFGGGANYFPGTIAGSTATGGQYA